MKIAHVTHTDLDGVGCEIVLKKYLESDSVVELTVYPTDYNTVDDILAKIIADGEAERIFITDISPRNPAVILALHGYAQSHKVVLLDHHETSKDRFDGYDWAHFCADQCGTMMLYYYLRKTWGRHDDDLAMESFAIYVDDYDRWIKDFPEADQLNQLFFFLGREEFVARCRKTRRLDVVTIAEEDLLRAYSKYIDRQVQERLEKIQIVNINGHEVALLYGNQFQSQLGEAARRANIPADYLAMIDISDRKVSLRTIRDGIHVGNIAKKLYLGGGNEKAAGFQLTPLAQLELTKLVFE